MEYELPKHMKLTKKENKQIEEKFHPLVRSFFNGLIFFITSPIWIYKKIKLIKEDKKLKGGKKEE